MAPNTGAGIPGSVTRENRKLKAERMLNSAVIVNNKTEDFQGLYIIFFFSFKCK